MTANQPQVLALMGLGLLGSSMAEATRKRLPGMRILGISGPATLQEALNLGLIDQAFEYGQAREAFAQCDLGFLCTPIDRILKDLEDWSRNPFTLKPGAVISDVGSTKTAICALGQKAFPIASGGAFIGSHPMAGSEKTGIVSRDSHLFENAAWILCPEKTTPAAAMQSLQTFVSALGARVLLYQPGIHDRVIAQVSHLPQIVATALATFTAQGDKPQDSLKIAGGGFRDMTRLAASSYAVWEPIFRTNRENVTDLLSRFRQELQTIEGLMGDNDLEEKFTEANALRARLFAPRKGFVEVLTEILVDLEDKPGNLLTVLTPLARARLNVLDLEILKVREGEEGVLMMGFRKPEEAQKALDLLNQSGFKTRLR